MTEQKKYKDLPIAADSFRNLINANKYFVDKTSYIKTVIEDSGDVLLFTRPRRFGKTLFMSMLASFLKINEVNPEDKEKTKTLFKDTAITQDKEFTDKYLASFPVISFTLKSVGADTFPEAYNDLCDIVFKVASDLKYLLDSDKVSDEYKAKIRKLLDEDFMKNGKSRSNLCSSIKDLSFCLNQHYKKPVVVLIDEYDVPLAKASLYGFHEKMVNIMSSFLDFLKDTPSCSYSDEKSVYKVIMTGCLKVAKNSIFTGVNNLTVNTVLSKIEEFSSMIGFNKSEVIKMLDDYDMSDYEGMVKENYDGYKFNTDEMFCPWDVVNFIYNNHKKALNNEKVDAGNYWNLSSSASSTIIKDYLVALSDSNTKILQTLQDLVDGKCIDVSINDSMNYDSLEMHKADDFYSLLLHTGYLTSVGKVKDDIYTVKIPNKEIYDCFKRNIMSYFEYCVTKSSNGNVANIITEALLKGDCDTAVSNIKKILKQYVSLRDFATKANKENYYHALLNGIFACATNIDNYTSNCEAGDGFADIIFEDKENTKAVLIELKLAAQKNQLSVKAQEAVAQIKEKNYDIEYTEDPEFSDVYCYGISFFAKRCFMLLDDK